MIVKCLNKILQNSHVIVGSNPIPGKQAWSDCGNLAFFYEELSVVSNNN